MELKEKTPHTILNEIIEATKYRSAQKISKSSYRIAAMAELLQ